RRNLFVELRCVDFIAPGILLRESRLVAFGPHALFGLVGFGEIFGLFAADFGVRVLAFLAAIFGELAFAGFALLLAVLFLVALILVLGAFAFVVLLARFGAVIALGKVAEDRAGEARKSPLVAHHVGQLGEILSRP